MYRLGHILIIASIILASMFFSLRVSAGNLSMPLTEVRESLSPMGEYRFIFRVFFKLYDAALFSSAPELSDPDLLLNGEHSVHLEFDYLREIKKSIVLESSGKILPKNMSEAEFDSIRDRVNRINDAYKTVKKGDRSALTFIPRKGTTLWINDKAVLTLPGADFARFYFRIWLGENPISKTMRDTLLQAADLGGGAQKESNGE